MPPKIQEGKKNTERHTESSIQPRFLGGVSKSRIRHSLAENVSSPQIH